MQQITIPYSPYDYQALIHQDTTRFRIIVGGRRLGKSKMCFQELLIHALSKPNQICWWVAPTYRDAREVGYEEFLAFRDVLEPAIHNVHQTLLQVTLVNGSKIYFKGSDNFNSLRGRGLDFVVMDEAAFCQEDAWKKAIRPALSDKQGRAILVTTPNGKNWFHDLFQYARYEEERRPWRAYHYPTWANPLITPEDLAEAKSSLSSIDFRQEYGAEFITKAGMVYDDFNEHNIIPTNSFIPDKSLHDIYLGLDFGYASYSAVCFMAVERATGKVCQFDEIYVTRNDVEQLSQKIMGKLIEWKIGMPNAVYSDPAGNAEELTSGLSPVDYLREKGFNVINKGTKIAPGLSLVRAFICNAYGQRRYYVTKRCKTTIESFNGYSYKLGIRNLISEEPDKDNVHDHMMDAVRYFFVNKFDNAKWVTSSPNQENYSTLGTGPAILKRCGVCKSKFFSKTPKDKPPFVCNQCEQRGIE